MASGTRRATAIRMRLVPSIAIENNLPIGNNLVRWEWFARRVACLARLFVELRACFINELIEIP